MKKELSPSDTVIQNVCKVRKNERVLIIANPRTADIAQDLYASASNAGARTTLIFQSEKTSFDNAEPEVIAAIATNPDVCISVSACKLGKDAGASAKPYILETGEKYTHIFDYLLEGKKTMRAVWTPGITQDMFSRTVNINYAELAERCRILGTYFKDVETVNVTAPSGTDLTVPVHGRKLLFDDGDFSKAGCGGNIPAGEVFISPLVGNGVDSGCFGKIVYDGSMTFSDGDSIIDTPVCCTVEHGFVKEITGGAEAKRLLKTITEAENRAVTMEKEGLLPEGMGAVYRQNARNIGELGIGLNPAAIITGNMLEDEKAFTTCHFAIGENYDNDAPSLIHLDGVVRNPTIVLNYADGSMRTILDKGILQLG